MMWPVPWVSIVLSVAAAFCFAVSARLQQGATREAALGGHSGGRLLLAPALLGRLLRDRRWLAGWAATLVGFVLHATALHTGSVAVVQAILVVQLLFALPMAAGRGRPPLPRDWAGTSAVCAGLILLVTVRGPVPQAARRGHVPVALVVAAALVAALVVAARRLRAHPEARGATVAVGAGIMFSCTAVSLVLVTADLAVGGPAGALSDWPLYAVAASTTLGGLLVQESFASGSLPTALTAMCITDPVVSMLAGIALFDTVPPGRVASAALASAALVIALGVRLLAGSPTLTRVDP